jgi:hypothetical protein
VERGAIRRSEDPDYARKKLNRKLKQLSDKAKSTRIQHGPDSYHNQTGTRLRLY